MELKLIIDLRADSSLRQFYQALKKWTDSNKLSQEQFDLMRRNRMVALHLSDKLIGGEGYASLSSFLMLNESSDNTYLKDEMEFIRYVKDDILIFTALTFNSFHAAQYLARHWHQIRDPFMDRQNVIESIHNITKGIAINDRLVKLILESMKRTGN
jgi:hypothetical protein